MENLNVSPSTQPAPAPTLPVQEQPPQPRKPFWKRKWVWIVLVGVVIAITITNINVEKTPLGHNIDGGGYHLVTTLFGTKHIEFVVRGSCSGALACADGEFRVRGADLETFKVLNPSYAADKNSVYFGGRQSQYAIADSGVLSGIPGADAATFTVLDRFYAKDKNSVYFWDKVLSGANPADFRILWKDERRSGGTYNLAVSNGKIFLGDRTIDYALRDGKYILDPKLQGILPCRNEQPYNNGIHTGYYSCDLTETGQDVRVEIDAGTFEALPSLGSFSTEVEIYAKDARYVYYIGFDRCSPYDANQREMCNYLNVVEGADPATFRIDKSAQRGYKPTRDARDAYYEYSLGGCKILGVHLTRRIRGHMEDGRCYYF